MKYILLYITFFLAFLLTSGTAENVAILAEGGISVYAQTEDPNMPVARPAEDPCIRVCIAANSVADVTVSQSPNFGSNSVRRYRPAGFSFEKLFVYLTVEKGVVQVNSYKNSLSDTQKYSALLKSDGYYIYALRKIII